MYCIIYLCIIDLCHKIHDMQKPVTCASDALTVKPSVDYPTLLNSSREPYRTCTAPRGMLPKHSWPQICVLSETCRTIKHRKPFWFRISNMRHVRQPMTKAKLCVTIATTSSLALCSCSACQVALPSLWRHAPGLHAPLWAMISPVQSSQRKGARSSHTSLTTNA
jgi:hypothetical protein